MKTISLPLERRCILSFQGPDAARYLNGQLTQDVRHLTDEALPSCVTDAKGKLQAMVHVFRGPEESIWIEGPPEQAEELENRLTRYLIADDVEVENLSSAWQLIHLVDSPCPPPEAPGFTRKANRIGIVGHDLWLPAGTNPEVTFLSHDEVETRRITAGVPAWGAELAPGMLPPEAGLDRTAISYHKGCYIGQEVLSRMKSAGRVNRRLATFLVEEGVVAGDELAGETRPSGVLTSVAPLPGNDGLFAALGYLDKAAFTATELPLTGKPGVAKILGFA
ncbi:YgfZ/GcvT domain-containing protein [Luteolibacter marinus]|uniref:CAF17-like 4Fe-4S cluster assembly/insertion protein YgfZ n=1 Tax=Luteolibacter marinus TaxID=2776705 RepID=UPI001867F4A8|nr:hypothetical protein [Luteolibacter marinus]